MAPVLSMVERVTGGGGIFEGTSGHAKARPYVEVKEYAIVI